MSDLLAARAQMAMSLGFHIIFAVLGIGMPLLMVLSERQWLKTRDPVWLDLTKRWSKGTAILFAVGAVSGTVLSFELGLLWPAFMEYAGAIIGMPFSLEGFAFFTEAIFLGIYLYGWQRLSERAHWWAGVAIAVSGTISGIFVVFANAWMNSPTGFRVVDGKPVDIDPIAAMLNPASFSQSLHMTLAAFATTGIAVAGIHAWMLRRDPSAAFHRAALKVALMVAVPASLLQVVSGDLSAKFLAKWQPVKLAALEGHFETERGASLVIGGIPDVSAGVTRYAIKVPKMLSVLAFGDPDAEVRGLNAFPREDWPPVAVTHLAFQIMVGLGALMALASLWVILCWIRKREVAHNRPLLTFLAVLTPAGFIAVEAGWVVTEVGRQPWIIQGFMRTVDAVTPMPGLVIPFTIFTVLYLFLGVIVAWLLWAQIIRVRPA
ncbi:MAG: cytochrome ubiquinol oxidase subunit I [Gemmatimonadaceae bacterium]|jgi:cytochrome d ubiquinol oxidase subunit I